MNENCQTVREQLAMLLYGELSFDEEERVESHLDTCGECKLALQHERELSAAFDQVSVEPSPVLLRECRENLMARLATEGMPAMPAAEAAHKQAWWDRFLDTFTIQVSFLRPVGALALLAVGFLGARLAPNVFPALAGNGAFGAMSLADTGSSRVRSVEPIGDGQQVRIVLDETRQRTVSGRMDDAAIRNMLLSATKDPSDGLRGETVALLSSGLTAGPQEADVLEVLVDTVRRDENAGVRLKAMDGLKTFMQRSEARSALADVLASDSNPAMRMRAIDMLTKSLSDAPKQTVDVRTIGVLQELMNRKDENPYMRQQARSALELVNASAEIY